MLLVRYRIGAIEDWLAANELDLALAERQAEGVAASRVASDPGPAGGSPTDRVGVA
jgi:hypothetical protein